MPNASWATSSGGTYEFSTAEHAVDRSWARAICDAFPTLAGIRYNSRFAGRCLCRAFPPIAASDARYSRHEPRTDRPGPRPTHRRCRRPARVTAWSDLRILGPPAWSKCPLHYCTITVQAARPDNSADFISLHFVTFRFVTTFIVANPVMALSVRG